MANPNVIASLHKVTKEYPRQKVLKGVSYDVVRGETLLITGPSGSGKSTSIRMIADLEEPTAGRVTLFNRPLKGLSEKERRVLISEKVSFGQQDPALDGGLSVFENLTLSAASMAGRRERKAINQRGGELAIKFGIAHLLERPADHTLSGGEKAKVALGRALVKRPELVILDEPTSAVDPAGTVDIYDRLRSLSQTEGLTIVMVSHNDGAAREFANREIVIDSGLVVAEHTY